MNAVIIVAGGKGLRMGGDIPKQFLPVGGKPILMRTIDRFLQYDEKMQVVLVLPESQQEYWRTLCDEYHFSQPYTLANGGETRFHSVKNGLALVSPDAQACVLSCLSTPSVPPTRRLPVPKPSYLSSKWWKPFAIWSMAKV